MSFEEAQGFPNGAMFSEEYLRQQASEKGTAAVPATSYPTPPSDMKQIHANGTMLQQSVPDLNPDPTSSHSPFTPLSPQGNCCGPQATQLQRQPNSELRSLSVSQGSPALSNHSGNAYLPGQIGQHTMMGNHVGMPVQELDSTLEPDFSGQTINYHIPNQDIMDFNAVSPSAATQTSFAHNPDFYKASSNYQYSPNISHQANNGLVVSMTPSAKQNHVVNGELHSAHRNCNCGPGCMCVFCSIHPYNEPTRERLRELATILAEDSRPSPESRPHSQYGEQLVDPSGTYPTTRQGIHPQNEVASVDLSMKEATIRPSSHSEIFSDMNNFTTPPDMPNTDEDFAQGYQTLELSVNPFCNNEAGNCMCGNECACLGCVTHSGHNGVRISPNQPSLTRVLG